MRLLLDTHILLWALDGSSRLPDELQKAIANSKNQVFVSAITVAEISIKTSLGKLIAPPIDAELLIKNGYTLLDFNSQHATKLGDLPWLHRDTFDRMLVAQAQVEDLILASLAPAIYSYQVPIFPERQIASRPSGVH